MSDDLKLWEEHPDLAKRCIDRDDLKKYFPRNDEFTRIICGLKDNVCVYYRERQDGTVWNIAYECLKCGVVSGSPLFVMHPGKDVQYKCNLCRGKIDE